MKNMKRLIVLSLLAALVLSACGGSDADATPTLGAEQIQTLAVLTFEAQLTQTALAMPTATPLPTNTLVPVVTFALPSGSPAAVATNTVHNRGRSSLLRVSIRQRCDHSG